MSLLPTQLVAHSPSRLESKEQRSGAELADPSLLSVRRQSISSSPGRRSHSNASIAVECSEEEHEWQSYSQEQAQPMTTDESSASLSPPTATRPRRRLCPHRRLSQATRRKPTVQHTASLDDQLAQHGESNGIIRFGASPPPSGTLALRSATATIERSPTPRLKRGLVTAQRESAHKLDAAVVPCLTHIRSAALLHCLPAAFLCLAFPSRLLIRC